MLNRMLTALTKTIAQGETLHMKNLISTLLLVISIGSVAQAQLVPGPSLGPGGGGGIGPGPGYGPGFPGGHGHEPRPGSGYPYPGNPYPSDPYPSYPYPSQPPYNPPPSYPPSNPGYGTETRRIYIGRSVYNEQIDLRYLAGLNTGYYSGSEIVAVRANLRPNSPGTTVAQLLVDGRIQAQQVNPGYQLSLYPNSGSVVLDRNARDVRLTFSGGTYIDEIQIDVRSNGGYNPPPNPGYGRNIDLNVYRSMRGNDRLDIGSLVNLSAYRGYRIQQVIVTGRATYQTSFVNLLINSFNAGQIQLVSGYSQSQSIYLSNQPMIGQGADSIVLYTSGDMTIERVTLVIR